MAVADESAQLMEYSSRLETQSAELTRTARKLREANDKLTRLSVQKDAFLSQISHELRTPMSSIRAFSEILRDGRDLDGAEQSKFSSIIHDEAIRLTRLLDDLLDLSVLENAKVSLNVQRGRLGDLLDRAEAAAASNADGGPSIRITRNRDAEDVWVQTDLDRLTQVFINLLSNARKYCEADDPELTITISQKDGQVRIDFVDNGKGISIEARDMIFEKFARIGEQKAGGAGLGLAICREIMARLDGEIVYLPTTKGAGFRLTLPLEMALAAQ